MVPRLVSALALACVVCAACSEEPPPVVVREVPPASRWPDRLALASLDPIPLGAPWHGRAHLIRPEERIAFLERSLATPLSEAEMEILSRPSAINPFSMLHGEELQRRFRDHVRWLLVSEWRRLGEVERAQSVVEVICGEFPGGTPLWHFARRVGESERESGFDVIRDRILKAEARADRDRDYWTARAEYFAGRGEHEETVRSFEAAVRTQPWDYSVGSWHHRGIALACYVAWLRERKDRTAALMLLTSQMERHAPESPAGVWILRQIFAFGDPGDHLARDAPWLWSYLGGLAGWYSFEGTLICWMAGVDGGSEDFWARVETLVAGMGPSRSLQLGIALFRCGREERALPFLRTAMRGLAPAHGRYRAAATILEFLPDDEEAKRHARPAK